MASVTKREWTAPDGEVKSAWVVRYVDGDGKRRMKTFDKQKDAKLFRSTVETEVDKGQHVSERATVTVRKLCDEYLKAREDMVRAGTIRESSTWSHKTTIDNDIIKYMGDKKVREINYRDIEDYYRWMRDSRKLHLGTISFRISIFSRIFYYGCKKGYGHKNQIADAVKDFTTGRYGRVEQFTEEQVRALLQAAGERTKQCHFRTNAMVECVINLAIYGGMRLGEILGLSKYNFDEHAGLIHIKQVLSRHGKLDKPKTSSSIRTIALPAHVIQMISDFVFSYYIDNKDGLIFTSRYGLPIVIQAWTGTYFGPVLVRAGLKSSNKGKGLHFHALRHFHASWLLDRNEPITIVSARLGHANPGITMQVYAHSIRKPESARPAIERMASAFGDVDRSNSAEATSAQHDA